VTLPVTHRVELPFQASPPWCWSRVGRDLHLVAADLHRGDVRHAVLDTAGRNWLSAGTPVPLAYPTGLTGHRDGLLITGAATGSEAPVILGLTQDASVLSEVRLPVQGDLLRWPVPLRIGTRDYAQWEEYAGPGTAVARCRVKAGRTFGVSRYQFPSFGDRTAVAVAGDTTLVARVDPASMEVRVLLLDDDLRRVSSSTLAKDGRDVAVSPAGDGAAIAWSDGGGEIRLCWVSPDLSLHGPLITVAQVDAPATVAGLKLASSGRASAVVYRTLTLDDPRAITGGPMPVLEEPRGTVRETVAVVDLAAATIEGQVQLDPPSDGAAVAAWVGPGIWVLHGSAEPVISQISASSPLGG
jgi:hypothetical protein